MANSEAGERNRRGWQAEKEKKIRREQGEEDARGQPPSHTASHRVRVKVRCAETGEIKGRRQKLDGII